ncbi:MAG: iron-containing alcohol dehydrogenase [Alphaproteobacteria bacterium]
MTTQFTFRTVPDIRFGAGRISELAQVVKGFGASRVLIVTDQGLVGAGLVDPVHQALEAEGLTVTRYDDVVADPPESVIHAASDLGRESGAEVVIGFGGGSSMDAAKLVALLAHPDCDQELSEMYGVDQVTSRSRLPLVLVPTTSGTGSEVTHISIVTIGAEAKMGVVSPRLYADCALLDPELTTGLPAPVTAATGIDAMVHALEAFTSKHLKNDYSDMLAVKAMSLMCPALLPACQNGADIQARSDMMYGSMLAGQAFANAPVAAVHALAYPLGSLFHVPHGLSNALMLLPVMRFNASVAAPLYAQMLNRLFPGEVDGLEDEAAAQAMIDWFDSLFLQLGDTVPRKLSAVGVTEADLDRLAEGAMLQTRLLQNNPREVTLEDARALYAEVL